MGSEEQRTAAEDGRLRRMDRALVLADLEHPGIVTQRELDRLRYLLGLARLTTFVPGAAGVTLSRGVPGLRRLAALVRRGGGERGPVSVADELAGFRSQVLDRLTAPLREEKRNRERLRLAREALAELAGPLAEARRGLLDAHRSDFSAAPGTSTSAPIGASRRRGSCLRT